MNSKALTALAVLVLLGWLAVQHPASAGHLVHNTGTFFGSLPAGVSKFIHNI